MMVKYAALSVALLMVYMCVVKTKSEESRLVKRGTARECSKALSELLSFVRTGRYHEPTTRSEEIRMVKRGTVRACGRALADLLSHVCSGRYPEPTTKKKRSNSLQDTNLFHDDWSDEMLTEIDESGKRTERGIVDECCRQTCDFSILSSYCASKK